VQEVKVNTYPENVQELLSQMKTKEEADQLISVIKAQMTINASQNGLSWFVPNGKIEELTRAVQYQEHKRVFVLPAANSVGKTAAAIALLGNIMWGSQSEWFRGGRIDNWKYPKKFWYISEHSTLKDFVCGVDDSSPSEIRKWFPRGRYEFQKAGQQFYSRLITDTGWVGSFKTYDMDQTQFESDKIGVCILDEPPPKAIYNAIQARLTLGGIIIMPMTPLSHSAWVKDDLVDNASEESAVFVLFADIESNCKEHGIRGILEHKEIERIIAGYDEEEVAARARGEFMHISGRVYKSLHPSTHNSLDVDPKEYNQNDYEIRMIMDPHDARPPMVAWVAVDTDGNMDVIEEYPRQQDGHKPFHQINYWTKSSKEVLRELRDIEIEHGWDPHKLRRYIDPNFGNKRDQLVGRTVKEQLRYLGRQQQVQWPFMFRSNINDSLVDGHTAVREMLKADADGHARLRFNKRCLNIWFQMNRYSIRPISVQKQEVDGRSEKVGEKWKDGADVVRYAVMSLKAKAPNPEEVEQEWFEEIAEANTPPSGRRRR